VGVAAVLV